MAATRRLRQGIRALLAFTRPVDYALAEQYLSHDQLELFRQMQRSEQLHGLHVLREVLAQEVETPDDLAIAALLHDAGKIRCRLPVWGKSAAVIVQAVAPALFRRWSRGNSANPLHRACIVMTQHPAWGAELVAQSGAPEQAIWLVAHHADALAQWEDYPQYSLLKRLQDADDAN